MILMGKTKVCIGPPSSTYKMTTIALNSKNTNEVDFSICVYLYLHNKHSIHLQNNVLKFDRKLFKHFIFIIII